MFLALVDGIRSAHFQTGSLSEALCYILFQIAALPHSFIVDIFNGIADFIVINLKCRTIRIQAKNGTGIRSRDATLAVAQPFLFG